MRTVTSARAAAPVRLVATAFAVASVLAFLVVGRADGASRSWSAYLAPESACRSASDAAASPAVQTRAMACMLNWARAPGSARAARPAPGLATRRCDEGRACRLLWPVLAYAVRVGGHRSSSGVRLPLRELRREPLRRNVGTGLRARRRSGVAPVPAASRERAQPALSRCRRRAGAGARAAGRRGRRRLDSHVRLSPLTGRTPAVSRESPAVREESQLDEMRSAIRGDFERLAERRGEQELHARERGREPRRSPRSERGDSSPRTAPLVALAVDLVLRPLRAGSNSRREQAETRSRSCARASCSPRRLASVASVPRSKRTC